MYNLDKSQIKRMTVEVVYPKGVAIIRIRLWNATGRPLRNDVPVHVIFPTMDIAAAPVFTALTGSIAVERGASAAPPVTAHTELVLQPDDTGLCEVSPASDGNTYEFFVQCGNATFKGSVTTGTPI
jgi:hypothetical protein